MKISRWDMGNPALQRAISGLEVFIQLSEIWLSSGPKSVLNIHLWAMLRKEGLHQSFKNRSDEFCRNGVCYLARICWRCCNISILSTKVDHPPLRFPLQVKNSSLTRWSSLTHWRSPFPNGWFITFYLRIPFIRLDIRILDKKKTRQLKMWNMFKKLV